MTFVTPEQGGGAQARRRENTGPETANVHGQGGSEAARPPLLRGLGARWSVTVVYLFFGHIWGRGLKGYSCIKGIFGIFSSLLTKNIRNGNTPFAFMKTSCVWDLDYLDKTEG